jgi:hypothetical protein
MNIKPNVHKINALVELEQLLGPTKGTIRTKLLHAAEHGLNVLELEVVALRIAGGLVQPRPAYLEIAARLADRHHNPAITEAVVRVAANSARQALCGALSAEEVKALAHAETPKSKLPQPVVQFILGLETD